MKTPSATPTVSSPTRRARALRDQPLGAVVVGQYDALLGEEALDVHARDEPDVTPGIEGTGAHDGLGGSGDLREHLFVRPRLELDAGEVFLEPPVQRGVKLRHLGCDD